MRTHQSFVLAASFLLIDLLAFRSQAQAADAGVAVGASANVLIGGSNKTISLQPLSIEGYEGLNVAAGIASINLKYQQ